MRRTLKSAILAFTSLASFPAFAEEEIVVTATRSPTPLERLPARIEVIDRAAMAALALSTLAEAIGPQVVQAGGAGQQASLFLRGANSKHVLALFDGVRLNDASTPNAQFDFGQDTLGGLERVEVLRGPASGVYGSDAIGGVVNMIPRRGGDAAFAPFMEASLGSFSTTRALVGAAGTSDGIEYGFSGERFSSHGADLIPTRMATHTGDPDSASISTLGASARAEAGALRFDALARVRRSRAEFDTFSGGASFDLRADDPDLENRATQTLWRLGAEREGAAGLKLRLSGGQVSAERAERDGGAQTSSARSMRDFFDVAASYNSTGSAWISGLAFERNTIETHPQFAVPLAIGENLAAGYVSAQFDLGARANATASLRIDDYERFGTQTTYAAGIVWNSAPVRLFASYATAFKAPSLSERFETSFFNVGNPQLRPEQSLSWEVGVDWTASEELQVGGSYFQTRIEDLIEYDFSQRKNLNVGEAAIDGVEALVTVSPTPWSNLRVAYAWTDARNRATGARLARRPAQTWRVEARATPNDRLALSLSWTFVGARTDATYDDFGAFLDSEGRTPAFRVATLSATFDLGARVQAFARVDNLGDAAYEQPAAFAGAARTAMLGVRAGF